MARGGFPSEAAALAGSGDVVIGWKLDRDQRRKRLESFPPTFPAQELQTTRWRTPPPETTEVMMMMMTTTTTTAVSSVTTALGLAGSPGLPDCRNGRTEARHVHRPASSASAMTTKSRQAGD